MQKIHQNVATPLISVLIPARNEELTIERCVRSLVAQMYERLEILVLDDASSDATAAIVQSIIDELPLQQRGRLRLLEGEALPSGWGGKNFACYQLAQQAKGDYLFFTDADTMHEPKMVATVLDSMQTQRVSLLTAQPTYELESLGEQLVVPLLTFTIMTLLPVALIPRRPESSLATGNGQLLCFERTAYERIGGHAAVKNRILEDVLLARATKAVGFRMLFVDAQDVVRCRMYRSFAEVWSGFSKNQFAFYNYSLPFALVALLLNILLFIVPLLLVLIISLLHLSLAIWLLAALAYLLPVFMRILLTLRFTHRQRIEMLLLCFLHPVSIALECLILLNSIRWHYRKRGTVWKGRAYETSHK
jgi:chlorobactene glucosyltransferase